MTVTVVVDHEEGLDARSGVGDSAVLDRIGAASAFAGSLGAGVAGLAAVPTSSVFDNYRGLWALPVGVSAPRN